MLTDFQNSSSVQLSNKFAARLFLYFPPQRNCVATLPGKT